MHTSEPVSINELKLSPATEAVLVEIGIWTVESLSHSLNVGRLRGVGILNANQVNEIRRRLADFHSQEKEPELQAALVLKHVGQQMRPATREAFWLAWGLEDGHPRTEREVASLLSKSISGVRKAIEEALDILQYSKQLRQLHDTTLQFVVSVGRATREDVLEQPAWLGLQPRIARALLHLLTAFSYSKLLLTDHGWLTTLDTGEDCEVLDEPERDDDYEDEEDDLDAWAARMRDLEDI